MYIFDLYTIICLSSLINHITSMTDKHLKYFFKQPQKKNQLLKTQQVGLTGPELHGFPYKDKSNQLFLHFLYENYIFGANR